MNKLCFPLLMAWVLVVFSGCAAQKPLIPFEYHQKMHAALHLPQDLENKVMQYWTFRSQGALKAAYDMEAPYIRELTPFSIYSSIFSKAAQVEKIEILNVTTPSSFYQEITLKLFIHKKTGQTRETVVVDRWVLAEGTWFHVIKDPVMKNYFP